MLNRLLRADAWTKVVVFLLFGSMFMGKASAYVALGFGGLLLLSPRLLWNRWYVALVRRQDQLSEIAWPLLISLIYGFGQLIYGILLGHPVKTAFQILIFNICPVYLFLGIWVGLRHPSLVRKYTRYMAWYVTAYAPLYFLFLHKLGTAWTRSDSGYVPFGSPGSGSVTLLGLLMYEPALVEFLLPILVLICLTIVNQERADWLGVGVALMVWSKLSRRMGRVFSMFFIFTAILLIAALIDFKLPPLAGRGGELSARGTLGRIAGSFSPEMAADVSGSRSDAQMYYGTVYWRKHWWAAIREEVSKDPLTLSFGLGYGYPLAKLSGDGEAVHDGVRSPHSIFYFALAYSGVTGVVIFFWFQICLIRLLYRVCRVTGQMFGMAYFLYSFVGAFLGNFLETPGAITFYLLLGLCIGPMFLDLEVEEYAESSELDEPVEVYYVA
jgi:hypothetical protein